MLIRYPYAKDSQIKFLTPWIDSGIESSRTIFEPFAGTAAVTFHALNNNLVDFYHINDLDESITALWLQVKNNPDELVNRIKKYEPNVDDFHTFKNKSGKTEEDKAFRKIVLHQLSYNGLGAMSSKALGEGTEGQLVNSRWNVEVLVDNIRECSRLLNSVDGVITNTSWSECVDAGMNVNGFLYIDPPPYAQGHNVFLHNMTEHDVLAQKLKQYKSWVLSYDNEVEVRQMYVYASVNKLDTWSHLNNASKIDLVIAPC